MSILARAAGGRVMGAQIHLIAGDNGTGKTTWAAGFPKAIIIDLEDGSRHIDVYKRLTPKDIPDFKIFRATLNELKAGEHEYQTVVIDSVESLESLICDSVCAEGKVDSIEKYEGGFGKGYVRSREIMREIMNDLIALRDKGITSILVAHTQQKSKTDPATNQTWDRVIMRANDKLASVIRDLSDNCFYVTRKVVTTKENNKTRAFGDGQSIMYTQYRPGFDAKSRLDLPFELPLSYDAFAEACGIAPKVTNEELIAEINAMNAKADEQIKKSVSDSVAKYKDNTPKLKEIKNRLMSLVNKGG